MLGSGVPCCSVHMVAALTVALAVMLVVAKAADLLVALVVAMWFSIAWARTMAA